MELNYHLPAPALQPLITVFGDIAIRGHSATEVVPAMLPNLHIRLAGRSAYHFLDGTVVESPSFALLGASAGAFRLEMSDDFEMLFAGLLPLGWHALVDSSAAELTSTIVDATLVWPASLIDRLRSRCQATHDPATRIALLEEFLLERRLEAWPAPKPQLAVVDRWIEHSAALSIDALCADLEVSARHLRRLTLHHYGLSPKTLAMKYRALRAATAVSIHGASVTEAGGLFADQSHLNRDFRRFIGWTPATFLAERQNLAAATLHGRWNAGARRPLSIFG